VRAKLRLGYDDVKSVNPRLIYASLTGYGETGPTATGRASTPRPISPAPAARRATL